MNTKEYHIAVEEYSDRLFRFALKLCKDDTISRDFVQDAYEKVWIKKDDINFEKIKSYLFRTVYNGFIDYTRKYRVISIEEQKVDIFTTTPNHDINEILHQALNQLSEVQKSAVLLKDYEGYNYTEIGEILNLNESQVKVYIYRARKHLQKYIGTIDAVI